MNAAEAQNLLSDSDPFPVEHVNWKDPAPILLLCEHAGRTIPENLDNLQLSEDTLLSHRAWDIGAEQLARLISERLKAPLIIQRYSRLVIDTNRPPGVPCSIPETSDGVVIPGNLNLTSRAKQDRVNEIFAPMDHLIETSLSQGIRACFSIHSFTSQMNGKQRPWHAGFLTRRSTETANALMASISRQDPDLGLVLNEPYQIEDESDWFIPRYAEALNLPHCLIEVRNDQIDHPDGVKHWADLLADAIEGFTETLT